MFFLLFIVEIIVIYILAFKSDFNEEHLNKAAPYIILMVSAFLIFGILLSIIGGAR